MPAPGVRAAAKLSGLRRYNTGKPCSNGHLSDRLVSTGVCLECSKIACRQWKNDNRDYVAKSSKERGKRASCTAKAAAVIRTRSWRSKDPIRSSSLNRSLYLSNRDTRLEQARLWYRDNKLRCRGYFHKRRLSCIGTFSPLDIKKIFGYQKAKCANCNVSIRKLYHIDHIIALSKGGLNIKGNIQLLCPTCNLRKHAKDPIVWARENGRLL